MSATQPAPRTDDDPIGDVLLMVAKAALVVIALLLLLPLVVPWIVWAALPPVLPTKARFWVVRRWQWIVNTVGVAAVVAVLTVEVVLITGWVGSGGIEELIAVPGWEAALFPTITPWVIVNLLLGALLVPATLSLYRRRVAAQVRGRRIPDVVRQTQIDSARKRAADVRTAAEIGVKLDARTGQIIGTRGTKTLTAPLPLDTHQAFGVVNRATIRNMTERFYDVRRVRDWIDPRGRYVLCPPTTSAMRALVIAESGTGKTVLLNGLMLCALVYGWPVVFIDAKGDPSDAEKLAQLAKSYGRTASVGGRWDLFNGTADQVTSKLMRLMPNADGANQHYLDEVRGVLQAVQSTSPIRSVDDLRERLSRPAQYVRDQYDLQMVNAPVDKNGNTAGSRALQALQSAMRPLEHWLDADGWSYGNTSADVTIVPLSPVDAAQAILGDLLLMDLRNFMATRLANRDKTPFVVVVDEFAQLVTDNSDPGDTAGFLFETARSAGVGLLLATQSAAGLSADDVRRRRALSSGAALIFGRSKDPEDVVKYAGTYMQMEASGAAAGDELRSARAQHTYVIPPQEVREAADGAFWLVQGGAIAPFRALPNRSADVAAAAIAATTFPEEVDHSPVVDVPPVPQEDSAAAMPEQGR